VESHDRVRSDLAGLRSLLTLAKRLKAMGQLKYQADGDPRTSGPGFGVAMHPGVLLEPLRWRKPRVVFVDSMADIAHAKVSRAFLVRVWATMAATPQHTYQLLTKRPERLRAVLTDQGCGCPHPHEPGGQLPPRSGRRGVAAGRGAALQATRGIDWVIVGGESGPGHRPLDLDWVRDLRDRCVGLGVAFFFKQVGGRTPKAGGRLLDGRTWDEFPAGRAAGHVAGGGAGGWGARFRRRGHQPG
jgi:protein gp37